MALTWTSFNNGENALSIRNKLNTFNNSVVTEVATVVSASNTNTTNITTNTTAIATNATDIATLEAEVATNTGDIIALEEDTERMHIFKYENAVNLTSFTTSYSDVINTTWTGLVSGVYTLTLSMMHNYNNTTTSPSFRFSLDGGSTWTELSRESKDIDDKIVTTFIKVLNITTTTQDIKIQAKKDGAGDTLTIFDISAILDIKA